MRRSDVRFYFYGWRVPGWLAAVLGLGSVEVEWADNRRELEAFWHEVAGRNDDDDDYAAVVAAIHSMWPESGHVTAWATGRNRLMLWDRVPTPWQPPGAVVVEFP